MKSVTKIRTVYRSLQVTFTVFSFLVEAALIGKSKSGTLKQRALLCQKYAKKLLRILNVSVRTNLRENSIQSGLIVCNHLSYLDIMVMCAEIPSLFVTSIEVKKSGWAGWVADLAGCLFVERRSRDNRDEEIRQIEIVLSLGIPVVVYPEATSSAGFTVLPFKSTLYECAIRARAPVHNFMIHYSQPEVAYYGDMKLNSHLYQLSSLDRIDATFTFIRTIFETNQAERKTLAQESETLIRNFYVSRV